MPRIHEKCIQNVHACVYINTYCLFSWSIDFFSSSILAFTALTIVAWKSSAPLQQKQRWKKGKKESNVYMFPNFPVCQLIRELCSLCIVFNQTKSIQGWTELINEYRILICLELIISRAGSLHCDPYSA